MAAWTFIGAGILGISLYAPKAGALFLAGYGAFTVTGVFGFMLGLKGVQPNDSPTHLQQIG